MVIPYLTLETVAYKYGLKANAEQTFTYRGDSMYYIPGIPYRDTAAGGSASYSFVNGPAIIYHEVDTGGVANIYAVSVCWHDPTTGLYKRLFHGTDYTDTDTGITLVGGAGVIPGTAVVSICYGSAVAKTITAAQSSESAAVKPGAVRSKNPLHGHDFWFETSGLRQCLHERSTWWDNGVHVSTRVVPRSLLRAARSILQSVWPCQNRRDPLGCGAWL